MKWRPIMFHTSLIPKVMDGTKTQSRRLVNMDQFRIWLPREVRSDLWEEMPRSERRVAGPGRHLARIGDAGAVWVREWNFGVKPGEFHFCCPLADGETILAQRDSGKKEWTILPAPDQRLWVKETWQAVHNWIDPETGYADDLTFAEKIPEDSKEGWWSVAYAARDFVGETVEERGFPWRSGRFMPRWASRTSLEVGLVRLQRLQDISERDALAEGVSQGMIPADEHGPIRVGYVLGPDDGKCLLEPTARDAFAVGWNRINGPRALWSTNPWVWAYTFKRIEVK